MSTHDRAPGGIVISGASGGLGQALVMAYAGPGVSLLVLGRDRTRLEVLAARARAAGALVDLLVCKGSDHGAIATAIDAFEKKAAIDLLICAAGTKTHNSGGIEDMRRFQEVIDTNLTFPAFLVQTVLPGMTARKRGRIALISSLAALAPHPDLLSYSASKAGLSTYAVALRRSLRSTPIGVTLVCPGFIDTPMTDNHLGPTPLRVSAADAALRIKRGIDRGASDIAFPRRLIVLTRIWNLLPVRIADWISGFLRARIIDPDLD